MTKEPRKIQLIDIYITDYALVVLCIYPWLLWAVKKFNCSVVQGAKVLQRSLKTYVVIYHLVRMR
jgi:hypothetical protein